MKSDFYFRKRVRLGIILILSVFLVIGFVLTSAHAGKKKTPRIFVKFGDIEGDATTKDYEGWSEATGISLGISNTGVVPWNTGSGAGRANFDEMTITKYAGIDGPSLAKVCAKGELLYEVKIESATQASTGFLRNWTIMMQNVLVTGISSGVNSTDGRLMEAIQLFPTTITWIYYEYDEKGRLLGQKQTKWDLQSNTVPVYPNP